MLSPIGMFNMSFLLTVTKKPGIIIGPIADVLGSICDFLFNFVFGFIQHGTFGLTIILFTVVVKLILFPLSVKQQKSIVGMRRIQPEIQKLQKKFKGSKDPEVQKRSNAELSELYRKNNVNPLSGCLPMLLQLPIIYALFYVIREAHLYISKLDEIFTNATLLIMQIPDYLHLVNDVAERVLANSSQRIEILNTVDSLKEIVAMFSNSDWSNAIAAAPSDVAASLSALSQQKINIEYFFSINLMETPVLGFPSIIIPIIAAISTLTSSLLLNKQYQGNDMNDNMRTQQMVTTWVMPIMMGVMAFTLPAGLGVYWSVSSIFQTGQQAVLNKFFSPKFEVVDSKKSIGDGKP